MRYKVEWLNKVIKDKIDNLKVWDEVGSIIIKEIDTKNGLYYIWDFEWLDRDDLYDIIINNNEWNTEIK